MRGSIGGLLAGLLTMSILASAGPDSGSGPNPQTQTITFQNFGDLAIFYDTATPRGKLFPEADITIPTWVREITSICTYARAVSGDPLLNIPSSVALVVQSTPDNPYVHFAFEIVFNDPTLAPGWRCDNTCRDYNGGAYRTLFLWRDRSSAPCYAAQVGWDYGVQYLWDSFYQDGSGWHPENYRRGYRITLTDGNPSCVP